MPTAEAVTRQRDKQLRKERKEHKKEPWTPPTNRWAMLVSFTGGTLVGGVAKHYESPQGDFGDKLLFGFGAGYEYRLAGVWSLGLNLRIVWKSLPHDPNLRNWLIVQFYSGSCLVRLSPKSRSSPYLRVETGLATTKSAIWNIGTRPYLRLGLGEWFSTSRKTTGRFELYWKIIFTKDHNPNYNAACIGLDTIFGIWL
jgi:hypothetical protein